MIALSVIILSVRSRQSMLARLLDCITPQLNANVELIIGIDDRSTPVWQRRNNLLAAANGKYVAYIDDDDLVADNYIDKITYALEADPDCVGFKVKRYTDGVEIGEAVHSLRFKVYADTIVADRLILDRTPNHLNAIKTSIARRVAFRDTIMEDVDYAQRLRPLLNEEVFVNEYLYNYYYVSPKLRSVAR